MQSSFQIGGAIGLAIVTAVVSASTGGSTQTSDLFDAYQTAIAVTVIIAAIGVLVALTGLIRERWPHVATATAD